MTFSINIHLWHLLAYLAVGLAVMPWYGVRVWRSGSESRRLPFWRWAWHGMIQGRERRHRSRWVTSWLLWPLALWEELR